MERQDFINTITELKAMISSLKLTIDTLSSSDDKFAERYDSVVAEVNGQTSECIRQGCQGMGCAQIS